MKKASPKDAQPVAAQFFPHEEKQSLRINKYLTASGFCSRREADRLVEARRVSIDGEMASLGSQVWPGQQVCVDGRSIEEKEQYVYIALHKPVGITCTLEQDKEGNLAEFMAYDERIFPIGRLDKDSSGLLLLTSDGDIVNKILRSENNHEKEYIVHVNRDITPAFIKKMAAGVEITNMRTKKRQVTKTCRVEMLGRRSYKIVLTQGLNRQIRRMTTELGYRVVSLNRVRIMNIQLGDLKPGQWRYLTQQELDTLQKSIS